MFRCSECGSEYKTKPDFCDCGNDTFEEFYPTQTEPSKQPVNKSEILSWFIFVLCLITSVFVLIFFPKVDNTVSPDEKQPRQEVKKEVHNNIPDINTFWIDSAPKPAEEEIIPVEQIKEVLNVFKPAKKVEPVTQQAKSKQTKPQQAKTQQQTKQQQAKPAQTVKKNQPVTTQTKKQTQTARQTKPQAQSSSSSNIEILNYKNGLMNRFLSNIPFAEVTGEGKCAVVFAVDETGKLIGRGFAFQSDNKSVNDAVYKMLMRTPRYNPPPESYKGEKFKLIVELSENSYKIYYAK